MVRTPGPAGGEVGAEVACNDAVLGLADVQGPLVRWLAEPELLPGRSVAVERVQPWIIELCSRLPPCFCARDQLNDRVPLRTPPGESVERLLQVGLGPEVERAAGHVHVGRIEAGGDHAHVVIAHGLPAGDERVEVRGGEALAVGRPVADAKLGATQASADALLLVALGDAQPHQLLADPGQLVGIEGRGLARRDLIPEPRLAPSDASVSRSNSRSAPGAATSSAVPFSIQNSPLRAVDEAVARELIAQQERWWVERKQQLDIEKLAAEIASFANSDGGWLLLNIADHGDGPLPDEPTGALSKFFDAPQDWLGQKLRDQLDPLPAFEATALSVDGGELGIVRVPRSPLAPVLATATGVLYERGAAGKVRIKSVERVRELVSRREAERARGEGRLGAPSTLPEVDRRLGIPTSAPKATSALSITVRATPLAYDPPTFEPVALGQDAAGSSAALLNNLLVSFGHRVYGNATDHLRHQAESSGTPTQRGYVMGQVLEHDYRHGDRLRLSATVVADAGGALGVRLERTQTLRQSMSKDFSASTVQNEWLQPVLGFLAGQVLTHAGAGPMLFDLWITGLGEWQMDWDLGPGTVTRRPFGINDSRTWIQAGAEAEPTLADLREANAEGAPHPLADVAARWTRDLGREAGFAIYEQWAVRER